MDLRSRSKSFITYLTLITLIVGATLLAWNGSIDASASDYLDSAMLTAGTIYATARGINALISLLQGTEVDAFVLTMSVGELLSPVSDLIERFSTVILLAIGALALQQVLFSAVIHPFFAIFLTATGVCTLLAKVSGSEPLFRTMLRFFVVAAVARFALSITIVISGLIDGVFLTGQQAAHAESMDAFAAELEQTAALTRTGGDMQAERQVVVSEIQRNRKAISQQVRELALSQVRLEEAQAKIKAEKKPFLGTTVDLEGYKARERRYAAEVSQNTQWLEILREQKATLRERLLCLESREAGQACSISESLQNAVGKVDVAARITALQVWIDDLTTSLMSLLAIALLKAIILPLATLYVIFHAARRASRLL